MICNIIFFIKKRFCNFVAERAIIEKCLFLVKHLMFGNNLIVIIKLCGAIGFWTEFNGIIYLKRY